MEHLKTIMPDQAGDLVDYFNRVYVTGSFRALQQQQENVVRVRLVPPMYPPAVWNVHEATLDDNPRTNNVCEGWNNKFANLVGYHHPSVWKVLTWFQKEHAMVETMVQQDMIGNPPKKRIKRDTVRLQERLKNLCRDRAEGTKTIPEFLDGIGHNIRITRVVE